jgi:hypothetical protein
MLSLVEIFKKSVVGFGYTERVTSDTSSIPVVVGFTTVKCIF